MAGAPGDDGGETGDMAHVVKPQGAACSTSSECGSAGGCVDGYCCDTTCAGACNACNLASKEGTCSPVGAGTMPTAGHPSCGPDTKASCKRDGFCDGAGACRNWALGTVCQPGTCNAGTNMVTSDSSCDGNGTCSPGTTITCAPYICKDATACWPSCTGNMQCSSGNFCNGNSCGKKPVGSACSVPADCQNGTDGAGHCVDGVCCDTVCTGTCQYCALSASKGTCSLVPGGTDPRSVCPAGAAQNAICTPGGCTGTTTACKRAAQNTPCMGSCGNNTANNTVCDAAGGCTQAGTNTGCGAYACVVGGGGTTSSCKSTCTGDGDCNQPNYACDPSLSQCALALGKSCGVGGDCASGACAPEGICCTRACTGSCEACSAAGVCNFVSGAPRAPRAACNSDANYPMCNGSCSGGSASCSYPTVTCKPTTCMSDLFPRFVQVDWTCMTGTCGFTSTGCGNYRCAGTTCGKRPCGADTDCIAGTTCQVDPVNPQLGKFCK